MMLADTYTDVVRNRRAEGNPALVKADPRRLFVTLTANCNLRCQGCNYGRDFMPNQTLPLNVVTDLIDDAAATGFQKIRLYGGEPLLHPDVVKITDHAVQSGLDTWMTTNAMLLDRRIDDLYEAGLRDISIGFYGTGDHYDSYVQKADRFDRLDRTLGDIRDRYGDDINIHLEALLMRPTVGLDALDRMWAFAEKHATPMWINLVHYSLPYFNEGQDRELQFRPEDRPAIVAYVKELLARRKDRPDLLLQPATVLRAIPDWLLKGPDMEVPCEASRLIWIGADGSVQLCYVTFKMGNLHNERLKDLMFTPEHHRAAQDAFSLNCPNCHCGFDKRTLGHGPSRKAYSSDASLV
jgi:cyclic pyranopterin phosphate synthase